MPHPSPHAATVACISLPGMAAQRCEQRHLSDRVDVLHFLPAENLGCRFQDSPAPPQPVPLQ